MSNTMPTIDFDKILAFRSPMRVSAVRAYKLSSQLTIFPICPRCQTTMEREYQSYCDRCGQALDWRGFAKATIILSQK